MTTVAVLASAVPSSAAGSTGGRSSVEGLWESDGYSNIVAIGDGRAVFYETTQISCAPGLSAPQVGEVGPDGTVRFFGDLEFTVRPDRTRNRLALKIAGAANDRSLRRLPALPPACTRPAPTGPLAVFDVFWQTFADNYPFFAAKGIEWSAVRARYRPRVRPDLPDAALFDLLAEMIEPLGDAHTGLSTADGRSFSGHRPGTTIPTLELEQRIRPFIERRDLSEPLQVWGNGFIGYADLPGRLGYLRLVTFAGYAGTAAFAAQSAELDRALDTILSPSRTTGPASLRGLIIDLRINAGGYDPLGLQVASRLTRQPYLAYIKQARNDPADPDRFTSPQPIWVHPAGRTAYTGPVAILTGGSTVSAGETFTQAMFGRSPSPTRIGANTQGVFSDTMPRSLPNGWRFFLPNEEFLTRDGRTFDGPGIPPHITVPVFTEEEFAADNDSAFDRAIALLTRTGTRTPIDR